ncbi:MAG: hypothetical protein AMXMBFR83_16740 [Phycisphaerae bacterium]
MAKDSEYLTTGANRHGEENGEKKWGLCAKGVHSPALMPSCSFIFRLRVFVVKREGCEYGR